MVASKYPAIADALRARINSGEWPAGALLPAAKQFATEYDASRPVISAALAVLGREGVITYRGHRGWEVSGTASAGVAARVQTWASTGHALGQSEESRIVETGIVPADPDVAARLDVAPGHPIHVRRRVVNRNGAVVHISSSYYPEYVIEAAPELAEQVSTGGSRELVAQRLAATQGTAIEEVTSRRATDDERAALGLTGDVVVTQVMRTVWLTDGRVLEVAVKTCSGQTALRWITELER